MLPIVTQAGARPGGQRRGDRAPRRGRRARRAQSWRRGRRSGRMNSVQLILAGTDPAPDTTHPLPSPNGADRSRWARKPPRLAATSGVGLRPAHTAKPATQALTITHSWSQSHAEGAGRSGHRFELRVAQNAPPAAAAQPRITRRIVRPVAMCMVAYDLMVAVVLVPLLYLEVYFAIPPGEGDALLLPLQSGAAVGGTFSLPGPPLQPGTCTAHGHAVHVRA